MPSMRKTLIVRAGCVALAMSAVVALHAQESSESSLECVLLALRDRTPGAVTWSRSELAGLIADDTILWIFPDGAAAVRRYGRDDLTCYSGADVLGSLKEPAYFDGCLAEPDLLLRFDCATAALADETFECAPYHESACD